MRTLALLLMFLLLAASAPALQLSLPAEIRLCNTSQSAALGPVSVLNPSAYALTNVTLLLPGAEPFMDGITLAIGDLGFGQSATVSGWIARCNESLAGSWTLPVLFTGLNGSVAVSGPARLPGGENATARILIEPAAPEVLSFAVDGLSGVLAGGVMLFTSPSQNVPLRALTDEPGSCRLGLADLPYASLPFGMLPNGSAHILTMSLQEGLHSLWVRCTDTSGNTMQGSSRVDVRVDTLPPAVSVARPHPWEPLASVDTELTTDEEAECRSSSSALPFEAMTTLSRTGLVHRGETQFAEGVYSLFFACRDSAGNLGSVSTTFEVDFPPTASVSLGAGTLRPGLYRVNLTASEPLLGAPLLAYTLSAVSGERPVALEGSGTSWSGYVLLEDTESEHVGSFTYMGTSLRGRQGSELLDGKLFLLDARPPEAPEELSVSAENGSLKLSWRPSDDAVAHRIYTSSSPFIGYADYRATVPGNTFEFALTGEGPLYFRVSSMDEAGNEGPLSSELAVTVVLTEGGLALRRDSTAEPPASPSAPATVETLRKDIASALLEIGSAQNLLRDPDFEVLAALGLSESLSKSSLELSSMEDALGSLSGDEGAEQLRLLKLRLARVRRDTPRLVRVHDRLALEQSASQEEVASLLSGAGILTGAASADWAERYLRALRGLPGELRITRHSDVFDVEYMDGRVESRTIITDEVSALSLTPQAEDSSGAPLLLVYLPKSVVSHVSEMEVLTEGYTVVSEDPLIAFPAGTKSVRLALTGRVSESDVRQIKTFLGYDPRSLPEGTSGLSKLWSGLIAWLGAEPGSLEGTALLLGFMLVLSLGGYLLVGRRAAVSRVTHVRRSADSSGLHRRAQIDYSLRQLARLSSELGDESRTAEELRWLRDLEIVEGLLHEAETAVQHRDARAVRSLYREMRQRYTALPGQYKKRIAARSMQVHSWLASLGGGR